MAGEITGFDPESTTSIKRVFGRQDDDIFKTRPMGYFAERGDLPMMRWLYVNGADTRDVDVGFYFPMFMAATNEHIEACKWLFEHGASLKKRTVTKSPCYKIHNNDLSPQSSAFEGGNRELSRWLLLNGALCKDGESGELDLAAMKKDLGGRLWLNTCKKERGLLLEWASELHQTRASFLAFLMGTFSPQYSSPSLRKLLLKHLSSEEATNRLFNSLPSGQYRQLWDELVLAKRRPCPVNDLDGKSGILERIGDYVGFLRGREARIIRQLTEILPNLFA